MDDVREELVSWSHTFSHTMREWGGVLTFQTIVFLEHMYKNRKIVNNKVLKNICTKIILFNDNKVLEECDIMWYYHCQLLCTHLTEDCLSQKSLISIFKRTFELHISTTPKTTPPLSLFEHQILSFAVTAAPLPH